MYTRWNKRCGTASHALIPQSKNTEYNLVCFPLPPGGGIIFVVNTPPPRGVGGREGILWWRKMVILASLLLPRGEISTGGTPLYQNLDRNAPKVRTNTPDARWQINVYKHACMQSLAAKHLHFIQVHNNENGGFALKRQRFSFAVKESSQEQMLCRKNNNRGGSASRIETKLKLVPGGKSWKGSSTFL